MRSANPGTCDAMRTARAGEGVRTRSGGLSVTRITFRNKVILAAGLATLVWGGECRDSGLWCVVQRVLGLTHEDDARGVTILLMLAVASLGAVAPFIPRWLARQRGR